MEKRIWSLWWQGEENAPLPVKMCVASIRRNSNGAKVIILDKDTYRQYVSLPDHILEKFEKGYISITNLSDSIRFKLLQDYGGLWIDSTVYIKELIPEEIFSLDFYTLKLNLSSEERATLVGSGKWCSYLVGGKKGTLLFESMYKMFSMYWENHSSLIAYLAIDYFFTILYETVEQIREQVDAVPIYEGDPCDFMHRRNDTGDLDSLRGRFQKLSWKCSYEAYVAGGGYTLYGNALRAYGFSPKSLKKPMEWFEKIKLRVKCILVFPNRCGEFGWRVAIWELLNCCMGPFSHHIWVFTRLRLKKAILNYLMDKVVLQADLMNDYRNSK